MVLLGLEKPSVVISPNPVLFQLPTTNDVEKSDICHSCPLPYRSIFAVLTLDTVFIYDTYHSRPLSVARGLHYASLTDCTWSSDGRTLIVSSTDGYISILSFSDGELGYPFNSQSTTHRIQSNTKVLITPTYSNKKDFFPTIVSTFGTKISPIDDNEAERVMLPSLDQNKNRNPYSDKMSTDQDFVECNFDGRATQLSYKLENAKRKIIPTLVHSSTSTSLSNVVNDISKIVPITVEQNDPNASEFSGGKGKICSSTRNQCLLNVHRGIIDTQSKLGKVKKRIIPTVISNSVINTCSDGSKNYSRNADTFYPKNYCIVDDNVNF